MTIDIVKVIDEYTRAIADRDRLRKMLVVLRQLRDGVRALPDGAAPTDEHRSMLRQVLALATPAELREELAPVFGAWPWAREVVREALARGAN